MSRRGGVGPIAWACAAALLLLAPAVARAAKLSKPAVEGTFGGSFAVSGTSPTDGGTSASLSLLWPVRESSDKRFGLRAGIMGHLDDAGSVMDSVRVDGVALEGGEVEQWHRMAYGASVRLDLERLGSRFRPFFGGTLGWSRVADDVRGDVFSQADCVGFSLGGGARVVVSPHVGLGGFARYHRLFNDRMGRFMSAGLDVSWR
jgi:hypothetical protein